jgi:para-aminobenzoate synthetase/4-amino-4-deoxychorismate lyase
VTPPDDGTGPERVWGRFDDLRSGTALACPTPDRILVADRVQDVADVLDQVQRATDAGRWAVGYVGYEAAAGLDPDLAVHPQPAGGMPLAWFGICDKPVPVPAVSDTQQTGPYQADWYPAWTPAGHSDQVDLIRDHVAAGNTFQCNLTVRMNGRVGGDTRSLYRDLVLRQRGAHNAYLDMGRYVIASASPELFFERRGDHILLRPMKGTSRRGGHPDEDRRLAAELRSSPKERAENIMIVDLMRNDIGRVALTGTVRVPELLTVERYETVLQMTSTVTAQLRPGVGLTDLFRVLFPCGSVTGTPKTRSMQIIRSIEPEPRGVYCGAIGLIGPPDEPVRARFNVAIRTAVVDTHTGHAVYGVGGGITWQSQAPAEHAEVLAKTAVLRASDRDIELPGATVSGSGRGIGNLDLVEWPTLRPRAESGRRTNAPDLVIGPASDLPRHVVPLLGTPASVTHVESVAQRLPHCSTVSTQSVDNRYAPIAVAMGCSKQ